MCASRNSRRLTVATKRWILSLLPVAMLAGLAACGSGAPVQNQPPPPPSNLCVTLTDTCDKAPSFPPVPVNGTLNLTATVNGDSSNGGKGSGVDWSLTCSSTNCGTLSAKHTGSGAPVTYTPPVSFPGNSETVSIVAFATADHAANALASITITAFGSSLS